MVEQQDVILQCTQILNVSETCKQRFITIHIHAHYYKLYMFVPKSSLPTLAILALSLLKKKENDEQFCVGSDEQ